MVSGKGCSPHCANFLGFPAKLRGRQVLEHKSNTSRVTRQWGFLLGNGGLALPCHGVDAYPASMDDLDGPVAGEGFGVGREAGRVPAVVTGVLSVQV